MNSAQNIPPPALPVVARRRRRGFTLAEVIIAVAIFGLAAAALVQTILTVHEAIASARERNGHEDARRFVLRRILASANRTDIEGGGSVTLADGSSVAWSATLEAGDLPDLHRVSIELDWDGAEPEIVNILVFRSGWSETETRSTLRQNFADRYPKDRLSTY